MTIFHPIKIVYRFIVHYSISWWGEFLSTIVPILGFGDIHNSIALKFHSQSVVNYATILLVFDAQGIFERSSRRFNALLMLLMLLWKLVMWAFLTPWGLYVTKIETSYGWQTNYVLHSMTKRRAGNLSSGPIKTNLSTIRCFLCNHNALEKMVIIREANALLLGTIRGR